jgi:hypothetical protein
MSVSDLNYKNKYLKYKNKYLNLQSQLGGINATGGGFLDSLKSMFLPEPLPEPKPVPKPLPSIPDELISSMLFYSNSLPISRETRRIMNSTTDIDSNKFLSLREKLGKTTVDKLFSTGEDIVINEQLNNKEIYLLAGLFVSNINNINIKNIYFDISKNMLFPLDKLKEALLNPTIKLILTRNINFAQTSNEQIVLINTRDNKYNLNDNYLDFQLKFIFGCILQTNIEERHITLDLSFSDLMQLKNSFNTIIYALKKNIKLTTLLLSRNDIGDEGTIAIAEALKTNTRLLILELNHNAISSIGVITLAEALKINTTLSTLKLNSNLIYEEGAVAIANVLKINKTLLDLDLGRNYLKTNGAVEIVDALKTNSTLLRLNLSNNKIGNNGVKPISDALKTNTTLTHINLILNEFDDTFQAKLAESLKENTTLKLELHY